jgi:hypothetical protein
MQFPVASVVERKAVVCRRRVVLRVGDEAQCLTRLKSPSVEGLCEHCQKKVSGEGKMLFI